MQLKQRGHKVMRGILLVFSLSMALPVSSGGSESRETATPIIAGVPVFEGDVKRPYKILGKIEDNLRKPFAFLPNPTREKILAEIWERGEEMGADAVIYARYGPTEKTLFNYGRTKISGTAIKYIDEPEVPEQ